MRWKIVALIVTLFLTNMLSASAVTRGANEQTATHRAAFDRAVTHRAVKATTPVEVSIYPITSVSAGQISTFTVIASSVIPSEEFIIDIVSTADSQLVSGDLRWQGSIVPGQFRQFSFSVRLAKDQTPSISVTASIQSAGIIHFAATATYRQQLATPSAIQKFSTERKVSRKGSRVIEYRVK